MQKFPYIKILFTLFLLFTVCCGYFTYHYTLRLSDEILGKFNGKKWQVPAIVYARPLELYPGYQCSGEMLEKELRLAGYRQENPVTAPGGYYRDGASFTIVTRGFHFAGGYEESLQVHVTASEDSIVSLMSLDSGEYLDYVRFDPARIGSFHPQQHEDRLILASDEIPELLRNGLKVVEDKNFDTHHGVVPLSILRALIANIRAGKTVQGGSTLTQQLVKNLFLDRERTLKRKMSEAVMALLLEHYFSKDEILTTYVNEVFLGQDGARAVHGFGMASQFYFRKNLEDLSTAQIATLIGMVKGPSVYDPRRHPERSRGRRDVVLGVMHRENIISGDDYQASLGEVLQTADGGQNSSNRFPAYMDLVRYQLQKEYKKEDLQGNGLQIVTNLNPQLQWQIEKNLAEKIDQFEKGGRGEQLQGAAIITGRENGEVLALVGDREPRRASFNRALDASRPIGSLVKPAVYLTGLLHGYTLDSMLLDSAENLDQPGTKWRPQNYDRREHGLVPFYYALAHSYNLATVRLGLDVGVEQVIHTLQTLGYSEPVSNYPSLLLGALEMSPLQVAQIYQTIASGGFYLPLRAIQSVATQNGEVLTRYGLEIEQRFSPAFIELLTHGLNRVITEGTAGGYPFSPDKFFAGKTGTSDDLRDSWFAGFSSNYSCVVWVGRDDNQPTKLTGSSGALRIWGAVMEALETEPSPPPATSAEIVWVDVARGENLRKDGEARVTSLPFLRGTEPVGVPGLHSLQRGSRKLLNSLNKIFN